MATATQLDAAIVKYGACKLLKKIGCQIKTCKYGDDCRNRLRGKCTYLHPSDDPEAVAKIICARKICPYAVASRSTCKHGANCFLWHPHDTAEDMHRKKLIKKEFKTEKSKTDSQVQFSPIREKPIPRASQPSTQHGAKPSTPRGAKPPTPRGAKPPTPRGRSATPRGSRPQPPKATPPQQPQVIINRPIFVCASKDMMRDLSYKMAQPSFRSTYERSTIPQLPITLQRPKLIEEESKSEIQLYRPPSTPRSAIKPVSRYSCDDEDSDSDLPLFPIPSAFRAPSMHSSRVTQEEEDRQLAIRLSYM